MGQLAPIINSEGVPDPTELQPLANAWVDPSVVFEGTAAARVSRVLSAASFVLPPPAATITATRPSAPIVQRSVSTRDTTFEQLALITGQRDSRITLAVADTAMDFRHPLLAGNAWGGQDGASGWDFIRNRALTNDPNAHHGNGSAVLAAQGTDRIRVMGMTVMEQNLRSYDPLFASIDYAVRNGARVINMSLTMQAPEYADRMREVLARYPEVLFVMAAGNQNTNLMGDTARRMGADLQAPNLMVVGAANDQGGIWRTGGSGSNTGVPWVTVAARGANVRTATSLAAARMNMPSSPASGTINETRAMTVSAVIGMVASGYGIDQALGMVGTNGAERARIRASVVALMNLRAR